jgi:PEGA domain
VRPYSYVPYRPYYFPRPYYAFRPHLSIGFGLWLGYAVPYPYAYLGSYSPRVYGDYPGGAYSVSVYGGVSFDMQPMDADVFVDGQFVGRTGDFTPGSAPLTLTPGVHHVAVQRDGFRPMEWNVTVQPGQVIPYRGEMQAY